MKWLTGHMRGVWRLIVAVGVFALVPAVSLASGIGYRNDSPYPVYVQSSVIVNGQISRGPLLLIKPGHVAWDVNLMKGNITITVYGTANQKLYQDVRTFQGKDQFHAIVPMMMPRGQPARVDLKELPLPPQK